MAKSKATKIPKEEVKEDSSKRTYIRQADVPLMTVEEALRIPQAIFDHYAGKPTSPLYVAKALSVDPKGSTFRFISGAAIAYGLIEGGAQATAISVTDLSRKILRPKTEGEDIAGRKQAVLTPRIFKEFLSNYNGSPFPRQDLALNVLEDMGVPRDKAAEVLSRIETCAKSVGFIEEINGKQYVSLNGANPTSEDNAHEKTEDDINIHASNAKEQIRELPKVEHAKPIQQETHPSSYASAIADDERRRKVFITHGKNQELVEPIKKLLEFGELLPLVSVQRQSVSKPVPEKVMDDMRLCGAAIIHVDAEHTIIDKEGNEHVIINSNVLIEIGAAMAFYGRRFILLVREGVKLPSNLQGLYEVRYNNETLDAHSTIKLLEAIKDIKNYALPTDSKAVD